MCQRSAACIGQVKEGRVRIGKVQPPGEQAGAKQLAPLREDRFVIASAQPSCSGIEHRVLRKRRVDLAFWAVAPESPATGLPEYPASPVAAALRVSFAKVKSEFPHCHLFQSSSSTSSGSGIVTPCRLPCRTRSRSSRCTAKDK